MIRAMPLSARSDQRGGWSPSPLRHHCSRNGRGERRWLRTPFCKGFFCVHLQIPCSSIFGLHATAPDHSWTAFIRRSSDTSWSALLTARWPANYGASSSLVANEGLNRVRFPAGRANVEQPVDDRPQLGGLSNGMVGDALRGTPGWWASRLVVCFSNMHLWG
jgi:hypothetical protein